MYVLLGKKEVVDFFVEDGPLIEVLRHVGTQLATIQYVLILPTSVRIQVIEAAYDNSLALNELELPL